MDERDCWSVQTMPAPLDWAAAGSLFDLYLLLSAVRTPRPLDSGGDPRETGSCTTTIFFWEVRGWLDRSQGGASWRAPVPRAAVGRAGWLLVAAARGSSAAAGIFPGTNAATACAAARPPSACALRRRRAASHGRAGDAGACAEACYNMAEIKAARADDVGVEAAQNAAGTAAAGPAAIHSAAPVASAAAAPYPAVNEAA